MDEYTVSFMCVYTTVVKAESFEAAAELAESECPLITDGPAWVINQTTGEEREV